MKEKLDKKYLKLLQIEKKLILILALTFLYQLILFPLFESSDDVGYGWFIMFGGWIIYIPILFSIIVTSIFYIHTTLIRVDYYKLFSDSFFELNDVKKILNLSQFFFYGPFFFLILGHFNIVMVLVSAVFFWIDVSFQNGAYKKIDTLIQ